MTVTSSRTPSATSAPEGAPRRRARRPIRWSRGATYTALVVGLLLTLMPFIWMALGSFKTQGELLQRPITWWPQNPTLDNYERWLSQLNYGQYFTNSIVVAVAVVLGNIIFCSMVGYALAKMQFPGKKVLFALVMLTLMVPGVVTLVPMFVLVSNMGLVNTYPALILPFLAGPLGVFLMRQFMLGIPDALIEAARIDGAGEFRVFFRIVLPQCGPPLATLSILTFLGSWNNFLWPLVVAQTENMYTLPVALSLYSVGSNGTYYGLLMAGSVLVVTPILILFLFLQRYFVQGIAMTGIK
ncbi:sugar-transport integral membrane protein ABC transporter [Mycobacteroides abscessus]|uniref:carbohydrate ABC transporter permease n=1 Tax=Cellulosimicrobium TaxID=157920 RepID=UPI0005DF08A0|nr:carbohydrate ABC transporter permease [Cellulosimicrobium cellulans]MBE9926436.1 carbohydrate ABC transporter permease [Cellulosimicrobium cellulans]CPU62718.1 sugar-transport integral membrane protein ABC transporter [Mycobacteroides abscessus]